MAYDHINDFNFDLPSQLIAQYPLRQRSASRLLTLNTLTHEIKPQKFTDILALLKAGDALVLNDTKVIPARLFGVKASGGKIECLIERILSNNEALAHLRFSKSPKSGSQIFLAGTPVTVLERQNDLFHLHFHTELNLLELLNQNGSIPLPLYIERASRDFDIERYQTIYAQHSGSVAAPTAGLHFDNQLFSAVQALGVKIVYLTLHIGAGTFQPVRVEALNLHKMHSELMSLTPETCETILECRSQGGRIIAVGTTVTRCLETAAQSGTLLPFSGETNLFIRPGYQFKCVDALLTNFHLPKSTLLMLVAAFGGYDLVMKAYQIAIAENFRFFSYGDAMFISNMLK